MSMSWSDMPRSSSSEPARDRLSVVLCPDTVDSVRPRWTFSLARLSRPTSGAGLDDAGAAAASRSSGAGCCGGACAAASALAAASTTLMCAGKLMDRPGGPRPGRSRAARRARADPGPRRAARSSRPWPWPVAQGQQSGQVLVAVGLVRARPGVEVVVGYALLARARRLVWMCARKASSYAAGVACAQGCRAGSTRAHRSARAFRAAGGS